MTLAIAVFVYATAMTLANLSVAAFPEFVKVFGWRDPKYALVYVNPSAADLAAKL